MSFVLNSGVYVDDKYTIAYPDSTVYRSFSTTLSSGTYTLSASDKVMLLKTILDGKFKSETVMLPYTFTVENSGVVGFSVRVEPTGDWNNNISLNISRVPITLADKFIVIAENEPKIYSKGRKDQYDEFWNIYQDNGNRDRYQYGFTGYGWTKENFYPKYDIKPNGTASYMFYAWENTTKHKISLSQRLKECGVVLDTSKATQLTGAFNYSRFTEIPTIDLSLVTLGSKQLFANCWDALVTIEKIIMNENTEIVDWFTNDTGLVNLTIEGTIGQNGFNVQWSTKLSKASILSILRALKDTGEPLYTVTLSKAAVNKAFETSPGANDGSESPEWYSVTNQGGAYWWTISLV